MALNLFGFVDKPFTSQATFNYKKFYETTYEAQRLMDDLVDLELEVIEKILKKIRGDMGKTRLSVNVEELKRTEASSAYVAQQIAWDLDKRMPYRRTIKKYLDQLAQSRDVKGAKVHLSGRLGGAEIARREMLRFGPLPLQTLRADIDYGTATAFTTYGTIGVKVWIYKGEIVEKKKGGMDNNSGGQDRNQ